jgi:hypothetical protein
LFRPASLFKTAKCRPKFPARGFADLEAARAWGHDFVRCYNSEYHHSGIRDVTPQNVAPRPLDILRFCPYAAVLQAKTITQLIRQFGCFFSAAGCLFLI